MAPVPAALPVAQALAALPVAQALAALPVAQGLAALPVAPVAAGPPTVGSALSSASAPAADADLVRRSAAGERAAFDELARRHQPRMRAICRRVTANDQDAQDAVQDALTAAWQRIGSFDGRCDIGTWFYRVATNAAIDEVRRRGRRPGPAAELPEPRERVPALDDLVADRVALNWAVAQLPAQFRAVVVLREFNGLSYKEIAEVRGIPVDTVKSQLNRGRHLLATLLRHGGAG